MKKIGIMTFHASYNCGSILQGMALQNILQNKFNKESEIIDFSNEGQQKVYSVMYKKLTLKNIAKNILCIPGIKMIKKHYEEYEKYIRSHFVLSEKSYSKESELHGIEKNYSMLIAGSDQIWNTKCDDADPAYFLSFAKNIKKIAYAPSLGATNILEIENAEEYKKYLDDFNYLSAREHNGKKWLEELTDRNVELVLDPTLLLTKEEWEKYIEKDIGIKGDFIFYNAISYNKENNEKIQEKKKKNNLKVIIIDAKQWYIKRLYKYKNFVLSDYTGPNAFLYLMKNSKYVITTSLHGAAFSSIFNKQFAYVNRKKHNPADDRAKSMLTLLNALDRFKHIDDINIELLNTPIDYKKIEEDKKVLKEKSLKYLEGAINN